MSSGAPRTALIRDGGKPARLRRPQSSGKGGAWRGMGLQAGQRFQETRKLVGTRHDPRCLWFDDIGDPLWLVRLLEHHTHQETKGAYGVIERRPCLASSDEVNLRGTGILRVGIPGGAPEEAEELRNSGHV